MKKSFTLIELIVVIAIIAILAAIIAPNAFKAIEKAKVAKAESEAKTFKTAVYALYADTGHWPGDDGPIVNGQPWSIIYLDPDTSTLPWPGAPDMQPSELMQNDSSWPGWDGPYLDRLYGLHPWGGTYVMYRQHWINGLFVYYWEVCYPCSDISACRYACGIPAATAQRMDDHLDDGDLTYPTGGAFMAGSGGDYIWRLVGF
ncbi:MAG: prepilin-type N-terminal cleavage/methylation domain-containing protein [Candidatus Omnitrophota bacterium]